MLALLEAASDRLITVSRGPLLVAAAAVFLVAAMASIRSRAEPYTFDHVILSFYLFNKAELGLTSYTFVSRSSLTAARARAAGPRPNG